MNITELMLTAKAKYENQEKKKIFNEYTNKMVYLTEPQTASIVVNGSKVECMISCADRRGVPHYKYTFKLDGKRIKKDDLAIILAA